ncbi:O-antigen ligase family protein [bacterium]|nr:hypothetical protein [bacterium]MBU3954897.1 O-antigen ligase family protein [bacterium]MBU4134375.1 O-antigen ligase family protein [bacterium]
MKIVKGEGGKMAQLMKNLILFLVFALPVIFIRALRDNFALPKVLLLRTVGLGLLFCLFNIFYDDAIWRRKTALLPSLLRLKRIIRGGINSAALVYLIIVLFATIFSSDRSLSWNGLYFYYFAGFFQLICYFVFFAAVQTALTGLVPARVNAVFEKKIHISVGYSVLAVCLYGLIQFSGLDFIKWNTNFGRIFSTLGNPDFLAGWIAMCLPVLIGGWLKSGGRKQQYFFAVSFLLGFITLLVASSRAGWLAAAGSLIVLILLIGSEFKQKIIFGVTVAMLMLGAAITLGPRLWGLDEAGIKSRLLGWKTAVEVIESKPLLGYGPDTFASVSARFLPKEYDRFTKPNANPAYAHNIFLDQAAAAGLPGLLAFCWLLVEFYRKCRDYPFIASGMTGGLIYGFFSIGTLSFWLYFWLYMGIAASLDKRRRVKL